MGTRPAASILSNPGNQESDGRRSVCRETPFGQGHPTSHQPVEQLVGLRSVPGLVTIRPADAHETVEAWRIALERQHGPTALVLSRQKLPILNQTELAPASGLRQGGYVLWEAARHPDVILIGTGSEVHIALEVGKLLQNRGISARVVSLPSWELFDAQSDQYRHEVLPPEITARVSIEAASQLGWERYVGEYGLTIGLSRFGASAPGEVIYQKLGFSARHVADEAEKLLRRKS